MNMIKKWFWIAVISFFVCTYIVGQQILRMGGANEPQIKDVGEMAIRLNGGLEPKYVIPKENVNFKNSENLFAMVFDKDKKMIATNADLRDYLAGPPGGVLDNAKDMRINKVTWQPEKGVRLAIVAMPFNNGWVLEGRSLKSVEKNVDNWRLAIMGTWIISVAIFVILKKRNQSP